MYLSTQINRMFDDPNRDEIAFWTLIQSYVAKQANRLVGQDRMNDLTTDVLEQVFQSLPRFKRDPKYPHSSFTRWISGIASRRAANLIRESYRANEKETPVSQAGTYVNDDKWLPAKLSALEFDDVSDDDYQTELDVEVRPAQISAMLDGIRAQIDPVDHALFAATRSGTPFARAAAEQGVHPDTARAHRKSWPAVGRMADVSPAPSVRKGRALSLMPDHRLAHACALGNRTAQAIADAWRFNEPVTLMSSADLDEISERCRPVNFVKKG